MKAKRFLAVVLAVGMALVALSGCTNGADKEASGENEKITMSIHMQFGAHVFDENWPVFQEAEKKTNVKLTGTIADTNSDATTAFNLMMASGEVADIVNEQITLINKYATQGAFMPLDDLIAEHAPNIAKMLDENPMIRKSIEGYDGKIYAIPFLADGIAESGWFIRQDWLDKLGLQMPTTVQEYHDVLVKIVNGDPNGNGVRDEVGYFDRYRKITALLPLFGGNGGWYAEDGKVYYGPYQPEYKEAIKMVAQWYAEGLIDKEIYTRGNSARDALFKNNQGASLHDWFGSTANYNDTLKEKVPGFELAVMAPPADVNGQVREQSRRREVQGYGWGIAKSNKTPEAAIRYFDFWFTEEGRRLANFGVEGVHYDMIDGKPIFKDEILHGDQSVNELLLKDGAQMPIGYKQDFAYEEQWLNDVAKEGMALYESNGWCEEVFPNLTFSLEEQEVIIEKWTAISTYVTENQQSWVLGSANPEEQFDEYIAKLKEMGIDEIIEIYNASYQRFIS